MRPASGSAWYLVAAQGEPAQQAEHREHGGDKRRAGPAPVLKGQGAGRGSHGTATNIVVTYTVVRRERACGSRS
jgi:hypothetical protein